MLGMPILYEYNSVTENIFLAKKLELDFIELNLNFGYCRKEIENKTLEKLFKENKLKATLHFYDEADFASYDEVCNAYLFLLEKYAKLTSNYVDMINVHLNEGPIVTISGNKNFIYEKEFNEYIIRLITNLKKAEKICNDNNITMVIENTNVYNYMLNTYNRLNQEEFKFNFDIGHNNACDCKLDDIFNKYPLKEMHFHDGENKKNHLSLGKGKMNLKYYKELAIKNNAYVLLEVKSSEDLIESVPYYKNL